MDDGCSEAATLGSYLDGVLPPDAQASFEGHLRGCAWCLRAAAWSARAGDVTPRPASAPRMWLTAAAAAALLVGLGLAAVDGWWPTVERIEEGRFECAGEASRTLRTGGGIVASRGGRLAFTDGTETDLDPGAVVRLVLPREGERLRIGLDAGAARFQVSRGEAQVIVETPRGEVSVLGTRFQVRLWNGFPDRGTGKPAVLEVLVEEGSVRISSGGSEVVVRPGQQGIVCSEARPFVDVVPAQASRGMVQASLERLDRAWRSGDSAQGSLALLLLRTFGEPARESLADRMLDPSGALPDRVLWYLALDRIDPARAAAARGRIDPDEEGAFARALDAMEEGP